MTQIRLSLLLCCLALPLTTFASAADAPQRYTCDNGSALDISFFDDSSGRPQASLQFADQTMILPAVPATVGTAYRSGDIRLQARGDDAIFEDGHGNLRRCSRQVGTPPPKPAPAAASTFIDITGNITYRTRIALPPGAILTLIVQDAARAKTPAAVLVERRYELNDAQVPIPFNLLVDRDLVGKKSRLTVTARIESGKRIRFVSDKPYPVTDQTVPLEIMLKTVGSIHR